MANQDHLKLLKRGFLHWNSWRSGTSEIPDLSDWNLRYHNLRNYNLAGANLRGAMMNSAYLDSANLDSANLTGACFWRASLFECSFRESMLIEADFRGANLNGSKFDRANLSAACLSQADCSGAIFREADMKGIVAVGTKFSNVDFTACTFYYAIFANCLVENANFEAARFGETTFAKLDLARAIGLAYARHDAPSSLGLDTLYESRGEIPEAFLRGCGTPEAMIEYVPSLTRVNVWQFYSVFISYSAKDEDFAKRLYNDLQGEGIRCWFAPNDLRIGDHLRTTIDRTIRVYDKLLLIFSVNSVRSQWVEQEVETALSRERTEGMTILFPIRLDDYIFELSLGWPVLIRNTRHVGDFSRWREHELYSRAFRRLVEDLKLGS